MNYRKLVEIVERHGLKIDLERLVTGAKHVGFFQFEITSPADSFDSLRQAQSDIGAAWNLPRSQWKDFNSIRHSDIDGKLYLLVDSFYDGSRPEN